MSKRALTAVLVLVAFAIGVVTFAVIRETGPTLTREQLLTYQDSIHTPLAEGGRVVEQDMKPKLADLHDGKVPPSVAGDWIAALEKVRADVLAVNVPDALREAARLFVASLDGYIEAARGFQAAALHAERREAAIDAAITTARVADRTYDDASRIIQRWRRHLGLDATPDFPDPTPT